MHEFDKKVKRLQKLSRNVYNNIIFKSKRAHKNYDKVLEVDLLCIQYVRYLYDFLIGVVGN